MGLWEISFYMQSFDFTFLLFIYFGCVILLSYKVGKDSDTLNVNFGDGLVLGNQTNWLNRAESFGSVWFGSGLVQFSFSKYRKITNRTDQVLTDPKILKIKHFKVSISIVSQKITLGLSSSTASFDLMCLLLPLWTRSNFTPVSIFRTTCDSWLMIWFSIS